MNILASNNFFNFYFVRMSNKKADKKFGALTLLILL